ncbi:MAG: LPS export ABC transporter periplasmic protein LptC [Cyclobacteriaceae bacterium]|nr:LPS export ABC transporter periplasmic protein LptC [Cyclobacteriaceae bacterium]
MNKIIYLILLTMTLLSCAKRERIVEMQKEYDGPMLELEDVIFYYSDSALVKIKGITPHRMEYANGNQAFPEGLYLEFYDETGKVESTIDANVAFYNKEEDHWLGQEGVVVMESETGKNLKTEELYWEPAEERIHTDKFVTITSEDEVLYGKGLDAKQDLSEYTIKNPTGDFQLEEGSEKF